MEPLLITIPEAAAKLGICRASAYNLIARGSLPCVLDPLGRRRVSVAQLDNYVNSLEPA